MSVLIKGMEMPRTCSDCEWSYYVGNGRAMCKRVSMTDKTDIMTKRRADFCPLIEVPTPHGRLIDAAFEEQHYTSMTTNPTPDVTEQNKHNSLVIVRALQMAKTIIEAED